MAIDLGQDAINVARKAATVGLVTVGLNELLSVILQGKDYRLNVLPDWVMRDVLALVGDVEQSLGAPLAQAIISSSTGLELSSAPGRQEAEAMKMVERMMGFAIGLPYATAELEAALRALLGDHAPESLIESIRKMPEEIGINFFIGTVLERIFETAVSRPLEEAIAEQKRPMRLEWPQIRALARQHAITDTELQERLRKIGFRESDIPLVKSIDRVRLTISELQQAYLYGLRDETFIRDYLNQIGIEGDDTDLAIQLYLKRAETAGGDQLRAVAQRGFLEGHINDQQYRQYLTMANVPDASAQLEITAASLVKQWGRVSLGVSEVKRLLEDNVINDAQAQARLISLGYDETDANALIADWHIGKANAHPGLTENRILAYFVGGVLTAGEAYNRLIGLGMRSDDARFLIQHPEASKQTKVHPLSDATIVAAMLDDILTQEEAVGKLVAQGHTESDARLIIQVALVKQIRGKKPKQPTKQLSEAHIRDALKQGLAEPSWAIRELAVLGYSEQDAMLIAQIDETSISKQVPAEWQILV